MPGEAIGDNAMLLWDFWWMRMAHASGADFLKTPYLFAPVGADLTLHTHDGLAAFVGATMLGALSPLTALNVTTLASLALNGFCAYLLAWRVTRDRTAALVAGAVFAGSPFLAAHLNGHFHLEAVWVFPLFALAFESAAEGSIIAGAVAGAILAASAFIDYYYVVYEVIFAVIVLALASGTWTLTTREAPRKLPLAAMCLSAAVLLDLAVIATILVTGGFDVPIGSSRISVRDTFNPKQIFWLLLGMTACVVWRPRVAVRPRDGWPRARVLRAIGAAIALFAVGASSILVHGAGVVARGEYVTQRYYWRSGPRGVDMATLWLGNPFHGVWGGAVHHAYERFHIDAIESSAWLGVVALAIAGVVITRTRLNDPVVRRWTIVGLVFFVWALGAHLMVFGWNSGMILPEAILRYVPIAGNARMPGRAMIVVDLAVAMVAAAGIAAERRSRRWPTALAALAVVLIVLDDIPAPFATTRVACPTIYQVLQARPERGAVAELPLGIGDGLGDVTPMDRQMLICQTIHARPLVGGVVSRLSPNVLAAYRSDPLLAAWLRLSGADTSVDTVPLPDARLSADRLAADDIAFVVLDRATASAALRDHVEHVLPLTLIAEDPSRAIYVTRRSPAASAVPD